MQLRVICDFVESGGKKVGRLVLRRLDHRYVTVTVSCVPELEGTSLQIFPMFYFEMRSPYNERNSYLMINTNSTRADVRPTQVHLQRCS
jgi:hypothetical protein